MKKKLKVKRLSEDVPTYVRRIRKKGNRVSDIIEEIRKTREEEFKNLQLERIMEEEKAKIMEAKARQQPVNRGLGTDFLSHLMQMAAVNPKTAKQFLDSLSEEDISKLSMLSAMGQGGSIASFIPLLKGGMNIKDRLDPLPYIFLKTYNSHSVVALVLLFYRLYYFMAS